MTSDVVDEEEAADDAEVLLPLPARSAARCSGAGISNGMPSCSATRLSRSFSGSPSGWRIQQWACSCVLAAKSAEDEALAARRALLHQVHLHVVRIARQAGLGPCTSYLQFGKALNQEGKQNAVLWQVAAATCQPSRP